MSVDEFVYPLASRRERIADGIVHLLGLGLAITGAVLLIVFAALKVPGSQIAAVSVYGGALIATFLASAAYHMTPWERLRPALRRIDHAAIFLKIAGTYTPLVVLVGGAFAYGVLALVWALTLAGAVRRLAWRVGRWQGAAVLYLGLGWLSVALIWPLARTLPAPATVLVVAGGLLYSLGVLVYARPNLRFANAIWHVFVLAASGCFFAAISIGTFA